MAMFNKKDGYEGGTVIAEGVKLQGEFHGQGPMLIEGNVVGNVSTNDTIEVGPKAGIEADLSAANLIVAGKIKGNVMAADRLELLSTGRIDGDVSTSRLVIAEGAVINGRLTMSDKSSPSKNNPPTKAPKDKDLD